MFEFNWNSRCYHFFFLACLISYTSYVYKWAWLSDRLKIHSIDYNFDLMENAILRDRFCSWISDTYLYRKLYLCYAELECKRGKEWGIYGKFLFNDWEFTVHSIQSANLSVFFWYGNIFKSQHFILLLCLWFLSGSYASARMTLNSVLCFLVQKVKQRSRHKNVEDESPDTILVK